MAKSSKLENIANTANGTKSNPSNSLEGKLKGYKESVAIGQLGGLATTAAGVYNVDKITRYVPGIQNLLNYNTNILGYNVTPGLPILGAGLNFIGDQIGFATSLYAFNREKYKGLKGKLRFIKDGINLGVRHLGSYFISFPLAIGASTAAIATGLLTGPIATIAPYVIESLITGLGYIFSTKRYRERKAASSPSLAYAPAYAT